MTWNYYDQNEETRRSLFTQAVYSCKYQNDLSMGAVYRYIVTLQYIKNVESALTIADIIEMGNLISKKNNGFRVTPAVFSSGKKAVDYIHIPRLLQILLSARNEACINPYKFFIEFEEIHPFNDGNGRVGEIIYWWMTGSFNCPHNHFSNHE